MTELRIEYLDRYRSAIEKILSEGRVTRSSFMELAPREYEGDAVKALDNFRARRSGVKQITVWVQVICDIVDLHFPSYLDDLDSKRWYNFDRWDVWFGIANSSSVVGFNDDVWLYGIFVGGIVVEGAWRTAILSMSPYRAGSEFQLVWKDAVGKEWKICRGIARRLGWQVLLQGRFPYEDGDSFSGEERIILMDIEQLPSPHPFGRVRLAGMQLMFQDLAKVAAPAPVSFRRYVVVKGLDDVFEGYLLLDDVRSDGEWVYNKEECANFVGQSFERHDELDMFVREKFPDFFAACDLGRWKWLEDRMRGRA